MKLAVIGSTGATGKLVVQEALRRSHHVVAVARTPSKLALEHERLSIVRGDVGNVESLVTALAGTSAVISCVGSPTTKPPITVYSDGVTNILQAMEKANVKRIVVLSSGALVEGRDRNYPLFFELVIKRFVLEHVYADMRRMEELVVASSTDWTLIRPSRLTDKPGPKPLRAVAAEYSMKKGFWTSRDRLAEAMLDKLEDPDAYHMAYAVANQA